jgi:AraC-like DNA-binding protein
MKSHATSSVRVLRAVVAALAKEGVDPEAFLAEVSIPREVLADDEARIPFERLENAWRLVPRWSRDHAFGLHLAEHTRPGAFDVLDYVARSCENLAEAFLRLVRFQRLLHDGVVVTLEAHGAEVWVVHRVSDDPAGVPRHAAEAAVASWILRARSMTNADVTPVAVRFQHAAPADSSEHDRILGCPVQFSCGTNVVVLTRATLALPIVTADSGLRALLDRHAEIILARLPNQGFMAKARSALADVIRSGSPDLAAMAKRLGTSSRSLQRRLAEEGTRFEDMLDEMRRELALRYLSEPEISLGEIAFLLGYSDPSAFHRAFRRWEGRTPQAHRREQLEG